MLSTSPSRRSELLASCLGLVLAVAGIAANANAGEVTRILNGVVQSIDPEGEPNLVAVLAAKGVTIGAPATVTIVIDDSVAGVAFEPFTKYEWALVDVRISVGTYEAALNVPRGSIPNLVLVGNDVPAGPFLSDAWNGSCFGLDTDDIFTAGSPNGANLFASFAGLGDVSSDEGVVQDLAAYPQGSASVAGEAGDLVINLPPQPTGSVNTGLARHGQLKAAAGLGSSVLKGLGKLTAAGPEKDPFGAKEEALLLDTANTFHQKFVAAVQKAIKKGGSAPLPASSVQEASDAIMADLVAHAEIVTLGVNDADKVDRTLRGKLLKAAGVLAKSAFLAHAADATKPNAEKLATKLAKAHAAFDKAATKALDNAEKQGLSWSGATPTEMADSIATLVDEFVAMTLGS